MGIEEILVTEFQRHLPLATMNCMKNCPVPSNQQINLFALSLSTSFVSWASAVLRTDVIA